MEQRHVSAAAAEFVDPTVVRQAYSGKLLPSELMALFRDASWPFATRVIRCGGRVRPLPPSRARLRDVAIRTRAGVYDLVDYVSRNRVAGLVIVRDGELMFEHYEPGSGPAVRWPSMSIAK